MLRSSTNLMRGALFAALILTQAGCAAKSLLNWNRVDIPEADAQNPVRKIVCIWEPKQGQGLDDLPTRGFAGQIMFFTNGSPSPAISEGDVRVYLFHDRGTPEQQAKPIHQFDFKGKAWAQHLTKSVPGPSYRIFIPYVDKQPWQVNCGLRVRLTPPNGSPVFSEMVYVRLPGPVEENPDAGANTPPAPKSTVIKKSDDTANIELGAVIKRQRGVVPKTAEATTTPTKQSTLDRARQILADELQQRDQSSKDDNAARSTSAERFAAFLEDAAANKPNQQKRNSTQQPSRQVVRGNVPSEPSIGRRFRLAPVHAQTTHPLNESKLTSEQQTLEPGHPLDAATQRPHPLLEQ